MFVVGMGMVLGLCEGVSILVFVFRVCACAAFLFLMRVADNALGSLGGQCVAASLSVLTGLQTLNLCGTCLFLLLLWGWVGIVGERGSVWVFVFRVWLAMYVDRIQVLRVCACIVSRPHSCTILCRRFTFFQGTTSTKAPAAPSHWPSASCPAFNALTLTIKLQPPTASAADTGIALAWWFLQTRWSARTGCTLCSSCILQAKNEH